MSHLACTAFDASTERDQRRKVLVVDDTPEIAAILSRILILRGYAVRTVLSGTAAIAACTEDPPDLVLLDISMPDMDGFQVCTKLKVNKITRDIPVIFVSAICKAHALNRLEEVGGQDLIQKPFCSEDVEQKIDLYMGVKKRAETRGMRALNL